MKQAPGNMFNLCNSIFTNYFHDFDVYLLCINLLRFHTLPPRFSSLLNLFENTYNIIKRTIIIVLQKLIEYSRFLLWHVPSILPWKIGQVQKDSLVKQTSLIHSEVLLALFYNIIFRSNAKSLKTLFSSSSIYTGKLRDLSKKKFLD